MLKCYFIDVKDINSEIPRSSFVESELEQLADLILEFDGLLRPLILREIGVERYLVIEGHREYYAAVVAKQKNLNKAEMVNAFVLPPNIKQSAIDQLGLFTRKQSPPLTNPIDSSLLIEQLSSIISQQLQPILAQLAEHKQILDKLNSNSPLAIEPRPNLQSKFLEIPLLPIPEILVPPKQPKAVKTIPDQVAKNTKSKKVSVLSASIDPIKATNTLNLINTLSQEQLTLNMDRSGLSKAVIKLVPNIITSRNTQPGHRFDTWETIISAKISGLGNATIEKIIDKLT